MKFYTKHIWCLLLILTLSDSFAQNYPVENLGEAVNTEYEEFDPVMSGDGTKLFFVRANHPDNRFGNHSQDIWYSQLGPDGKWKQAERLPNEVNLTRYNAVFWSNESGDELIIKGSFDDKGSWKKRGLSSVSYKNGSWTLPVPIKIKGFDNINDGAVSSIGISESGTMMVLAFTSVLDSRKSNIYISVKLKNSFSRPIKIKDLSSKFDDQAPFLNADHNKIYFSSNRSSGADNYNIYVSERQSPEDWTKWSAPTEVSYGINSSGYQSYFRLINEGKAALFVSDQNTIGNSDIFMVTFEESKPKEITLNALIKDIRTNKPLTTISFDLNVDGAATDFTLKSPDSAIFEFQVTEKDSIEVTASVPGYSIIPRIFNLDQAGNNVYDIELIATKTKETPVLPSMLGINISGKLIDRQSRAPIEQGANPIFRINDEYVDSTVYNPFDGAYRLYKEANDSTLVLSVVADGYLPYTQVLKANPFLQINHNIELKKRVRGVVVSGLIVNSKTQQPIEDMTGIKIAVNGKMAQNVSFINEEKSFQLYLNKDSVYTVTAQLNRYFGTTENIDLRNFSMDRMQKNLYLTPVEAGQTVKLNNIFFATGSSELLKESIPELNRVADFLRENPSVVVEIAGHTDNVGSDAYNQKLSEERAKSVARYIILKGFSRDRIEFKGYGEAQPVTTNATPQGREQNRRVEFKVLRN